MRYLKPDAGKTASAIEKFQMSGDGFPLFVSFMASFLATPIGVFVGYFMEGHESFLLLIIFPVLWIIANLIHRAGCVVLPDDMGREYWDAWKVYNKLEDTDREVARPLMQTIIKHSQRGHPGGNRNGYDDCSHCTKRKNVMRKLMNQKALDNSDIEYAEAYLEGRKELA